MNKRAVNIKKLLIVGLVFTVLAALTACSSLERAKQTDLKSFYELVSDDQYVILIEGENVGITFKQGDEIYLPYQLVNSEINDKFYLDSQTNSILYTTMDAVESYPADGDKNVITKDGELYLALSLVEERTEMNSEVYTSPNRVVITKNFGTVSVCRPKQDTVIRQYNRDGADYMAEVSKGESLVIKEKKDKTWFRVVKDNGITGYIKIDETKGEQQEERTCEVTLPEYSHITMENTVCMGWHQMESVGGNATLAEVAANGQGILNVISPTWFKLADQAGNISSNAQSDYVEQAHSMGLQVWALADDFSYGEDGTYYVGAVLENYDSRQNLIQNLVSEVKASGADGLNIDFEKIYEEIADDYIQFIRELSIVCRKEQIVLSVDTYVEQPYNTFYNRAGIGEAADYLVIMGYDEHWAGDSQAGSVASLPYISQGIDSAVAVMDAKRVINGIPFFTRIWSEDKEETNAGGTFVEDAANGNYWLNSKAVGMSAAEEELASHGVSNVWLEDLGQYYGEYQTEAGCVRVWLEEERSIQAKLDVMEKAGVGGVAFWKLGLEKAAVWDEIGAFVQ